MYSIFSFKRFFLPAFAVFCVYLVLAIFFMNRIFIVDILKGNFSIFDKLAIILSFIKSIPEITEKFEFYVVLFISLLTGVNSALLWQKLRFFPRDRIGKSSTLGGGASLLGIIGSFCTSCTVSVLAFLGFGGSLFFLPFQGKEISYIALFLLFISFYFLIKDASRNSCQK